MKLNKKILKEIVKECLIEILAEGLVSGDATANQKRVNLKEEVSRKIPEQSYSQESSFKKPSYLDNINFGKSKASNSVTQHEDSVQDSVSLKAMQVTKDPIMSEIFADTAATTLREQASASSRKPTAPVRHQDKASAIVDQTPLDDLFGDASDKWAALAFASATPGN